MKLTPVGIAPWVPAWSGFLLSREPVEMTGVPYWARRRADGCWVQALAGVADLPAADLLDPARGAEEVELHDLSRGVRRWARIEGDRLAACLFAAPGGGTQPGSWPVDLFSREALTPEERRWLLSGRAPSGCADRGPVVCACLGVGRDRVVSAISQGVETVAGLGERLGAGTGCGSCIPELKELISHARRQPAA